MARLRIKVGATEVEYEGGRSFLKTCLPEFFKVVERSELSPDSFRVRDNALAAVGELQSDTLALERSHQILSGLSEEIDAAVKTFRDSVESFTRAVASDPDAGRLLSAARQMQETQMSFNLQYLQLQSQMQHENRSFTAISNIMKTKHDTVKNSISNIR